VVEVLEAEALQEVGNMTKINKKTGEIHLLCPRCHVEMEKLIKNDVVLDICTMCRGMWTDKGELKKLAKIAKEAKK